MFVVCKSFGFVAPSIGQYHDGWAAWNQFCDAIVKKYPVTVQYRGDWQGRFAFMVAEYDGPCSMHDGKTSNYFAFGS